MRPGHAAQRVGHQQQRQPEHRVPAQRPRRARAGRQKNSSAAAQRRERHDDGLQRVLQHQLVGHARPPAPVHGERQDARRPTRRRCRDRTLRKTPCREPAAQWARVPAALRLPCPIAAQRAASGSGAAISMCGMPASSNGSPRGAKPRRAVEALGAALRVQHHLAVAARARRVAPARAAPARPARRRAAPGARPCGRSCATPGAGRQQPPGGQRLAQAVVGHGVHRGRVVGLVPFQVGGNALLLDEDPVRMRRGVARPAASQRARAHLRHRLRRPRSR